MQKGKKWFKPVFDIVENETPKEYKNILEKKRKVYEEKSLGSNGDANFKIPTINHKNWMKNFDPVNLEDLAVHNKKIQEVENWIKDSCKNTCNILLLSGPVGCGKTATVHTLAAKYNVKITEWITPIDIELPTDYGEYEFKEKQSKKFLDFIISAANFTSLLDNNSNKLVLVEDFPNTFLRTPSEFSNILQQYTQRAKSPIVFICSETNTDNKNAAVNIFTTSLKEQFLIQHIVFNSVSVTGLRSALKRVSDIISKKYSTMYNIPTTDIIDSVVNTSAGDVRSAILNLHFASLKVLLDESGRAKLSHSPEEIVEQFLSSPSTFINFLEENYLPHFSCINNVDRAVSALSDADYILAEWREKYCQEYGLYIAVAGLMLANKSPVSAWNPVRGPKNMNVQYPLHKSFGTTPKLLSIIGEITAGILDLWMSRERNALHTELCVNGTSDMEHSQCGIVGGAFSVIESSWTLSPMRREPASRFPCVEMEVMADRNYFRQSWRETECIGSRRKAN